jgi:hypothetical protein
MVYSARMMVAQTVQLLPNIYATLKHKKPIAGLCHEPAEYSQSPQIIFCKNHFSIMPCAPGSLA